MKQSDLIWNRAAMDGGGQRPARGDRALSALLSVHGLAMNGGVLHAIELLDGPKLIAALDGYRFFGFDKTAELLSRARDLFIRGVNLDKCEIELNLEYSQQIHDDAVLAQRFEQHFALHPDDFAPARRA